MPKIDITQTVTTRNGYQVSGLHQAGSLIYGWVAVPGWSRLIAHIWGITGNTIDVTSAELDLINPTENWRVAEVELKIAQGITDAAIADYNDMKAERDRLRELLKPFVQAELDANNLR